MHSVCVSRWQVNTLRSKSRDAIRATSQNRENSRNSSNSSNKRLMRMICDTLLANAEYRYKNICRLSCCFSVCVSDFHLMLTSIIENCLIIPECLYSMVQKSEHARNENTNIFCFNFTSIIFLVCYFKYICEDTVQTRTGRARLYLRDGQCVLTFATPCM